MRRRFFNGEYKLKLSTCQIVNFMISAAVVIVWLGLFGSYMNMQSIPANNFQRVVPSHWHVIKAH